MKFTKMILKVFLFITLLFLDSFPVSAFNSDYSATNDAVTVYITDLGVTNKADYIKILIESNSEIVNTDCKSATETNIDGGSATLMLTDIKGKEISNVIVKFRRDKDVTYELTFLYYYADSIYDTKNITNTVYSTDGSKETSFYTTAATTTTTSIEILTFPESQDTVIIIDSQDTSFTSTTESSSITSTTTKKTTSKTTTQKTKPVSSVKTEITTSYRKTTLSTASPEEYEKNRIMNHMDEDETLNNGFKKSEWKYCFLIMALMFLALICIIIIVSLILYFKNIITSNDNNDDEKVTPAANNKELNDIDNMTNEELFSAYINTVNSYAPNGIEKQTKNKTVQDDNTITFTIHKDYRK